MWLPPLSPLLFRYCLPVLALALVSLPVQAQAPTAVVTEGDARVIHKGNSIFVIQSSDYLSIDWSRLNLAAGQTLRFVQPGAQALAINNIQDSAATTIFGQVSGNGQLWFINPNGITIGASAQVEAAGVLFSSLPLTAINGWTQPVFASSQAGQVTNYGRVMALEGGYVAMLGTQTANYGQLIANQGTVAMLSGGEVSLTFADNRLVKFNIDRSTLQHLADNQGLMMANAGQVWLSAGARDSVLQSVVNHSGVIEANTVAHQDGKIILLSGMTAGETRVSGRLQATASAADNSDADTEYLPANGGFIETSGHQVKIASSARISTASEVGNTGTWLIDPTDFNVAAKGGDMTGKQLSLALQSNHVQILSTQGSSGIQGNINISDRVSWSANTTLRLSALNDVNVANSITAAGAHGRLEVDYGMGQLAENNTSRFNVLAPINLKEGNNLALRQGSDGSLTEYMVITRLGNSDSQTGSDLQGIQGNLSGHYALGANIDASATSGWNGGEGFAPIGTHEQPFSGSLNGLGHVISHLTIQRPEQNLVGLIGEMNTQGQIFNLGIHNGYVVGHQQVGGLVGANIGGLIYGSYFDGAVLGDGIVGGLVGLNTGFIINSYAQGSVSGAQAVGGLVGVNTALIDIIPVEEGAGNDGNDLNITIGVIAFSYANSTITVLESEGELSALNVGGLAGYSDAFLINSFWNTDKIGFNNGAGEALAGNALKQSTTFKNALWDMAANGTDRAVWRIYEGHTLPLLSAFLEPLDLGSTTRIANGQTQTANLPSSLTQMQKQHLFGSLASGKNAGVYFSDVYSDQTGFNLTGGTLTLLPPNAIIPPLLGYSLTDLQQFRFNQQTGSFRFQMPTQFVRYDFNHLDVETAAGDDDSSYDREVDQVGYQINKDCNIADTGTLINFIVVESGVKTTP